MRHLYIAKKIIRYFPVRFGLTGLFFSYLLLSNSAIRSVENQILSAMLIFFHTPAYVNGNLVVVGNMYDPVRFDSPVETQILFLAFFISLAVCTRSAFAVRAKILFHGMLCFGAFVMTQFSIIVCMLALGFTSNMAFLQASTVSTGMVGSLFIEISLFSAIKLPERRHVPKMVKRSYADEYAILAILLVGASLLVYFIINFLKLQSNSPLTAYLALNLSTILYLRYYLAYFIYEIKTPKWVKLRALQGNAHIMLPISFLLPAYNEEKHIRRCIESIDKAAGKYSGNTEIVVVNDGSTDNTKKISSKAILGLRNAGGRVYSIPNSGKGFALQYGLERITGDVVFRIDSDSFIDENAISRVMGHFDDPLVGSVSGMIMPLEEKSWIQKIWVLHYALLTFYKRGWELIDSVLVQPGAFSVFRKSALVEVGGWADDMLGEDSDITVKLARCGYRNEYEQHAIAFSDIPSNLKDLREQRLRWSMSFYHARSAHLDTMKDFNGPISIMYSLNIVEHGLGYANALFVPYLISMFLTGYENSVLALGSLVGVSVGMIAIESVTYGLQSLVYVYFLAKFKKLYLVKYIPMMRLYSLIYSIFIETEGIEILLSVTSKWKTRHTKELTKSLREKIKEGAGAV
ncbi:MAG: glycosyltransferase [Clostridiales bacterium]